MSFPCLCCSQGPVSYFSDESTESSLPSDARDKDVLDDAVYTENPFNKLSNDLLHKFMSSLSIKETVRTGSISKRWVNVWKDIPHLSVDLREFSDIITLLTDRTHHHAARSMTKVHFFFLSE
ncbi:unnamed protein product [Thlaspi arvense]|uniref:F-box domain-containing protein n=1 Tax=Thlaspi arvense TaxID=13288 RepID=A0AAU9T2I9_THLAR|nr:unnamed protein product [Thlaspi arvense]